MPQQQKKLVIDATPSGNLDVHDRIGCELIAEALRAGGQAHVRVMGTSMLPALWPGDILIIRNQPKTPSAGEIVLFLRYGRLFAHRVVRTMESELITRGDALPDRDPPVHLSEVLGVVVGVIRDGPELVPVAPPSYLQALVAFAIRRSEALYRMVLRLHQAKASSRNEQEGNALFP